MSATAEQEYSVTSEIEEAYKTMLLEADELLRILAVERREPTEAELAWFSSHLGWDDRKFRIQRRRVSGVVRFQAIAGTRKDREAAKKEAETSLKLFNTEAPTLDAEIERLQSRRERLHRDKEQAAKRVEEQAAATAELLKLCPLHVAKPVAEKVTEIRNTLGREINEVKGRIKPLELCLNPDDLSGAVDPHEHLQRFFPEAITETVEGPPKGNKWTKRKLSPEWPRVQREIVAELAELKAKLPDMESEFEAAIAKAEEPLDYYTDPSIQEKY